MTLPKVGAEAVLIHDKYDRDVSDVIAKASKVDAALDDLSGTIDVKVGVSDQELKDAVDLAADLDSSTTLNVNVDDEEVSTIVDQLNALSVMGAIDLALNFTGAGVGIIQGLGRFSGLGSVLEIDTALATLEARTGRMIPQAEQLIEDIYTDGWGESKTAIADVVAQAAQLGLEQENLASATETAFQVAAVTGGDVNEVLSVMDTLVKSGLVPSYTAAGDVMVTGFQAGLDKQGDLNDSLSEYATKLASMGITAEGTLAILNSGMEVGVMNTDFLSDSIREFGIRLGDMSTDENIAAAFEQLDTLSDIDLAANLDAYNAGKMSGDDFLQGMFDAVADANEQDPQAANNIVEQLFGTQAEDLGAEIWGQLSTDADAAFGEIEGRAEEAGTAISNSLGGLVEMFLREVETAASDFLSSDAINLDEKIDTLKQQITTGLETLSEGGSLGDALEIGFGITGVDDALNNIQRVFGQFVISILEVVAFIKDPTGLGNADDATRAEIARLATQQLPFDIQVANPEELDAIFTQAMNRGVTDLNGALRTGLDELVASGDFEQVIGILDAIEQSGADPAKIASIVNDYVGQLQTGFDEAIASGDFDLAKKISDAQNDPTAYTDAIKGIFGFDGAAFDTMIADSMAAMTTAIETEQATPMEKWIADAEAWATQADTLAEAQQLVEDAQSAMNAFGTDTEAVLAATETAAVGNMDGMIEAIAAMQLAVTDADTSIANDLTGNTVTASFEAVQTAAESHFPSVIQWLDKTTAAVMKLDNAGQRLPALGGFMASLATSVNNFPFDRLQSIVNLAVGYAGAGNIVNNNSDTTINVNQTNNVQNGAQARATTYDVARAVTG